ncbi:MAG: D-alanyl-D-alanine carboxypeptidase [Clostridia bacterium]|nr:D-alanyl-D-alanine carboxypeptidase [Clostridia bacterium]
MKKTVIKALCIMLCLLFAFPVSVNAEGEAKMPVTVNAKAAILVDASTGQVLAAMNEHDRLYPASVTKIMTLLLVMEAIDSGRLNLTDEVVTSATAAAKGGSQIWLKEGETMTVDELLRAAAIYSANDACEALGEHIAGSEEALVQMLNDRAKELGMNDTHFDNCTGLDDTTDTHLTSAFDVALMSVELLKHELIQKYSTVWMDSLRNGATELVNTNKLIRFYDGATGLKTGTTAKAGCCVSASAMREGTHLVAVIMGSPTSDDRFGGAKALLNWGFANYETVTPAVDLSMITRVNVIGGVKENFMPVISELSPVLINKGESEKIEQSVELVTDVQAPVEAGQKVGSVKFILNGETLGEYPLTSEKRIEKLTFAETLRRFLCSFDSLIKK